MDMESGKQKFLSLYGEDNEELRGYFAPGRVNLIGEHIDYNGGHVFPCAIPNGITLIVRKRKDRKLRFYSENYPFGVKEDDLDTFSHRSVNGWTNYLLGVIAALKNKNILLPNGLDCLFFGNIPGSGLSSSAALEVVFGTALNDLFSLGLTPIEVALIGQESENKFNGMNCGIMDQFASAMGKKDKAILLDCATLKYTYVPLHLNGAKIIVTNSNKPHSLVSSHYNERRAECEEALKDLQTVLPIKHLCELTPEQFDEYKGKIHNKTCLLRAKHAVYEENRTQLAVKALNQDDLVTFGHLLTSSGDSLRYDYDATCFEIDTLVEASLAQKGVLGSRETGGGWGGNTITLIKSEDIPAFEKNVSEIYTAKTHLKASFVELEAGEGARRLF